MLSRKEVNVDFVCVVSECENRYLEYKEVLIENQYEDLIKELESILKDDEKMLFDLQDKFNHSLSQKEYNYCYPYSYSSVYVSNASLPKKLTKADYQQYAEKQREMLLAQALDELDDEELLLIEEKVEKEMIVYDEKEKNRFFRAAVRYIKADQFQNTLSLLKKVESNKMFSDETTGWNHLHYHVNEKVSFYMKTNFGFGKSSYFFINFSYHGILILPYSAMVKYYYVNVIEVMRYTRQYEPWRESWKYALKFAVSIVNDLISDESLFIKKWVIDEVDRLIFGLEDILNNPQKCYEECLKNKSAREALAHIRSAYSSEIREYQYYPKETLVLFQARKLIDSYHLIEKMKKTASIYPQIGLKIQRIVELNKSFLLLLESERINLRRRIKHREQTMKTKEYRRKLLERRCKPHLKLLEKLKEVEDISFDDLMCNYFKLNKTFASNYKGLETMKRDLESLRLNVNVLRVFLYKFESCISNIKENLLHGF